MIQDLNTNIRVGPTKQQHKPKWIHGFQTRSALDQQMEANEGAIQCDTQGFYNKLLTSMGYRPIHFIMKKINYRI